MNLRLPFWMTLLVLAATAPLAAIEAHNPCPDQPVHTYHSLASNGNQDDVFFRYNGLWYYVAVADTNISNCNPWDATPFMDWDGDYDNGIGGAFFGYGAWTDDPDCNYRLNHHGSMVTVDDIVFGSGIKFIVGEDDQNGPVKVVDPETGLTVCTTTGAITPGDPFADPTADADDCIGGVFTGTGWTCGSGGGDGGYWVALLSYYIDDWGNVVIANPPIAGTITAY